MKSRRWEDKLEDFCNRYDLEIEYLAEVLNDPKVVPMIRGKSFEFSAKKHISKILSDRYEVTNPRLNAQTGQHDIDIAIFNTKTNKKYSVECKLSKKGSFKGKLKANNNLSLFEEYSEKYSSLKIQVKCMRSRTLGEQAAKPKSKARGLDYDLLMTHNDQYIPGEFDLVVTSIANAFYVTDKEDGLFYWHPPKNSELFLRMLNIKNQHDAFFKMYVATSESLAANDVTGIKCSRKKCLKGNCNFIPNYPVITFDCKTGKPLKPWIPVEEIETLLN